MKRKALLIILSMCLLFVPIGSYALSTADANAPISTDTPCTLTLEYTAEQAPLADHAIALYRVADVSSEFRYTLCEPYADTQLTVNGISSQTEWDVVRNTLESYIAARDIAASYTATTDENGYAVFTEITPGLYYVPSLTLNNGSFRYYFASAVIALPSLADDGSWSYDVSAKPKPAVRPPSSDDIEYKVVKLWKGDEANNRPQEITVDLIRDGEVQRSITLSSANDWCYSWSTEDDGSVWTVYERDVPEGYRVTVNKNETAFTLTNSYGNPPDVPETGDSANLMIYIILVCISGIGLVTLGLKLKTDKK